jgi:hypothetical protein
MAIWSTKVIEQYTKIQFHLRESTQSLCYENKQFNFLQEREEHIIIPCENDKTTNYNEFTECSFCTIKEIDTVNIVYELLL